MNVFESFWIDGFMPVQFLALLTVVFFAFVLGNTALKRVGWGVHPFWQVILIWLAAYAIIRYIVSPPLPASVVYQYMGLVTIVLFFFISTDEETWQAFKRPIVATLAAETRGYRRLRATLFLLAPFLSLIGTYQIVVPRFEDPLYLRTPLGSGPATFIVHGQVITQTSQNPFRINERGEYDEAIQGQYNVNDLSTPDPWQGDGSKYLRYVREGGAIFFQNCVFCHSGNLSYGGDSASWDPYPSSIKVMFSVLRLDERYFLWLVSQGGAKMPREMFPWSLAMPPSEEHLTTDEMWKVILFVYWYHASPPLRWD